MELFIFGALVGALFILLLALTFAEIEEYSKKKDIEAYLKNLSNLSSTLIFSGIADDDYIPSFGECVFSKSKQAVVLGDGKTSVKDLEILSYYEGD